MLLSISLHHLWKLSKKQHSCDAKCAFVKYEIDNPLQSVVYAKTNRK